MTHLLEDFQDFLSQSPTSFHATNEMGNRLAEIDFIPLAYDEKWKLEKGKRYFTIHHGSLAAFVLPEKKPKKMAIAAAHTDSPAIKLKPHPVFEKYQMELLGVEIYGSPILPTWLNRDLAIAGRVALKKKNGAIEQHLVFFEDAPVIIPLIAPHLDREIYKKGLEFNKNEHLIPIAGLKEEGIDQNYLESLIRREINFEKLLDFDLFLVPLELPKFIGKNGELFASYRLDNLASVHAGLTAIASLETPSDTLPITIFWDHEEIGSLTNTGAQSPFFKDLYERILDVYQLKSEEEILLRNHSLCLSVDLTHAVNPLFEKKYDPHHLPILGRGLVIKYNANMRYSTNAESGGFVANLCDELKLPYQKFAYPTDNPGGTTIGPVFSTHLGIETADIGIAELSMHASREIIAWKDHIDMCTLLTHFLQGGE